MLPGIDDDSARRTSGKALRRVVLRYAFGVALVGVAFGFKILLEPVTGTGAPFVLFFGAVVATSIWAGPGPGVCAVLVSIPLGAYVFVVRAGYTGAEAATQSALFAVDGFIIIYLSVLVTRARRAAETSDARQRDLIELSPDAFFLADLDGRLTNVNQSACRMLGYERQELTGCPSRAGSSRRTADASGSRARWAAAASSSSRCPRRPAPKPDRPRQCIERPSGHQTSGAESGTSL